MTEGLDRMCSLCVVSSRGMSRQRAFLWHVDISFDRNMVVVVVMVGGGGCNV